MESLIIKGEHKEYYTPSINFDAHSGICEISGESFLEDTAEFYDVLVDWLLDFCKTGKSIALIIRLTYFNTTSSRSILAILDIIKDYEDDGSDVVVNWHCNMADEDMIEEVNDYEDDTGLKINLLPL